MQQSREAVLAKETCAQTLLSRGQASEALGFYKVGTRGISGAGGHGQGLESDTIRQDAAMDDLFQSPPLSL